MHSHSRIQKHLKFRAPSTFLKYIKIVYFWALNSSALTMFGQVFLLAWGLASCVLLSEILPRYFIIFNEIPGLGETNILPLAWIWRRQYLLFLWPPPQVVSKNDDVPECNKHKHRKKRDDRYLIFIFCQTIYGQGKNPLSRTLQRNVVRVPLQRRITLFLFLGQKWLHFLPSFLSFFILSWILEGFFFFFGQTRRRWSFRFINKPLLYSIYLCLTIPYIYVGTIK